MKLFWQTQLENQSHEIIFTINNKYKEWTVIISPHLVKIKIGKASQLINHKSQLKV